MAIYAFQTKPMTLLLKKLPLIGLPLDNEFMICPWLLLYGRASIHAYQTTNLHIVVIKVDEAIYKGILEPFIVEVVNEVFQKHQLNVENAVISDEEEEDEEGEIPIIVPWITFYK